MGLIGFMALERGVGFKVLFTFSGFLHPMRGPLWGLEKLSEAGQWQRAVAILADMQAARVRPDATCINAGISACARTL